VSSVPHYHFEFRSNREHVPDPIGKELRDLKAAHQHALTLVEKTIRVLPTMPTWRGWRVVITDEQERALLAVLFPPRGAQRRMIFRERSAGLR
jgi:hypothetical protein